MADGSERTVGTRGRKTKYTPEVLAKLEQAIGLGATYKLAAAYAGITFETFNSWRQRKAAFSDLVKRAEGRAVVGWLAKIEQEASNGNWQAAAWKLERRYPEAYGRRIVQQEQSGLGGGAVQHEHRHQLDLQKCTLAQLEALEVLLGGDEEDPGAAEEAVRGRR